MRVVDWDRRFPEEGASSSKPEWLAITEAI